MIDLDEQLGDVSIRSDGFSASAALAFAASRGARFSPAGSMCLAASAAACFAAARASAMLSAPPSRVNFRATPFAR